MRTVSILCFATVALTSGMVWASAAGWLDPTSGILTEHENVPKYQDPQPIQPYAELNFSDEAAQTLGVHNGRWEAFDNGPSHNGWTPNLSGGFDKGNPTIRLRWYLSQ